MKRIKYFLSIAIISLIGYQVEAQIEMPAPSPLSKVTQKFGMGEISLEYSRPAANGRKVMGELVPFGKVWRTGANGTTLITFTDEVKIQGQDIKPGTYGLYSIPAEKSWEIMLYSDLKLGGNINSYNKKQEVARFKVETQKTATFVESFTIEVQAVKPTSASLFLMWENTAVELEITTEIDDKVMKNIDKAIKNNPTGYTYFQAATYYYNNDKDIEKASTWIDNAVKDQPNAYYMMLMKAKIEYKAGNKEAGEKASMQTIELAKKAKSSDYIRLAEELIKANQ